VLEEAGFDAGNNISLVMARNSISGSNIIADTGTIGSVSVGHGGISGRRVKKLKR
jgi:hypothetical protein